MDVLLDPALARAPQSRAPRWLLAAGLIAGAAAAATGLLIHPATGLPDGAVARVNQQLIGRDAWLRAVAAVASERRTPLTDADQRHILDRLVDEELLVQHGLALGLAERDARLRSTMVSEVMLAASNGAATTPDDDALRLYYAAHRESFAPAARLRVRAWRLDTAGHRGEFLPPVPDALLPPAKLETYLGPALTAQALALAPGQESAPIAAEGGPVVLAVLAAEPGAAPPFEQVREDVRLAARRDADETAVRALLAQLRAGSQVVVDPKL